MTHARTRETASSRGYDSQWRKARDAYLRRHSTCRYCEQRGITTAATVVDHIIPHKGDRALFWDSANWQSLCKTCHDSHKRRLEHGGSDPGCTESGLPIDPSHHWYTDKRE